MENNTDASSDYVAKNITTFKPENDAPKHTWCWPPDDEVMTFVETLLPANKSTEVETCFEFLKLPKAVPAANGNKHVLAAHCLIFAPTNDVRKGCAMVSDLC